jgi:hypothetical protein
MAHGGKAYAPLPTDVAVDRAPFNPGLDLDYGGASMGRTPRKDFKEWYV